MSTMASIADKIAETLEDFQDMEDPGERFTHIIELGRDLPALPDEYYAEEYKVEGCVSQVWLHADVQDGRVCFEADSDAAIVKGLISLLISVYSGHPPEEILAHPPDFLQHAGISASLSPNRSNGLASMARKIMLYAKAFSH